MTLNDNLNEISDINIGFSKLEIGLKATLMLRLLNWNQNDLEWEWVRM